MRRAISELATSKYLFQNFYTHRSSLRKMSSFKSIDELNFVNRAIHELPLDEVSENYVRKVPNACFSLIKPTPVANPRLIALSKPALALVDLDGSSIDQRLVDCFSGNSLISGSETAAHCYCGHQFGVFAGQLGDGAAVYLGEVKNSQNKHWELQLKGAGKTPYSRDADGRKVLRSSIREFLCSEAMHHLGIPTTRAGTCIVSDETVVRDQFYDGRNKQERCTVVLRIAESFLRFGSFEIFKPMDQESQRVGPSFGRTDILVTLTDFTIRTLYPEIEAKEIEQTEKYKEFYTEIVRRTASLVAKWQGVGFVHGVLNTDNMSIIGLTLDYGPYGFMDRFDSEHVPNTSDPDGRYSYRKQPEVCFWNLLKLAEALNPLVCMKELKDILRKNYFAVYNEEYLGIMSKKLGLQAKLEEDAENSDGVQIPSDTSLAQILLSVMSRVGSDYTNTMRLLSTLDLPRLDSYEESREATLNGLLEQSTTRTEMISRYETFMELPMVQMRVILLKNFAEQLKEDELSKKILSRLQHYEHLQTISDDALLAESREEWSDFLDIYSRRLEYDTRELSKEELTKANTERRSLMNRSNPRIILRNHLAEDAIQRAENDDFTGVQELLAALETPFSDSPDLEPFTKKPTPTCNLRVSCSS